MHDFVRLTIRDQVITTADELLEISMLNNNQVLQCQKLIVEHFKKTAAQPLTVEEMRGKLDEFVKQYPSDTVSRETP